MVVVDRIKTFVRSKSNERGREDNKQGERVAVAGEEDTEYLKTIKLRMSRPTRMTVTDEINNINI